MLGDTFALFIPVEGDTFDGAQTVNKVSRDVVKAVERVVVFI